jgi:WG containing repeat
LKNWRIAAIRVAMASVMVISLSLPGLTSSRDSRPHSDPPTRNFNVTVTSKELNGSASSSELFASAFSSAFFDSIPALPPKPPAFSHGLRAAWQSGRVGYQNADGAWIIPAKFTAARPFSQGLAAVQVGEGESSVWGFIDTLGHWRIEPQFVGIAHGFTEGHAAVFLPGLVESPLAYIDTSGGLVFDAVFSDARPFQKGQAEVRCGPNGGMGQPYAWGRIDTLGHWLKPCENAEAEGFVSLADLH